MAPRPNLRPSTRPLVRPQGREHTGGGGGALRPTVPFLQPFAFAAVPQQTFYDDFQSYVTLAAYQASGYTDDPEGYAGVFDVAALGPGLAITPNLPPANDAIQASVVPSLNFAPAQAQVTVRLRAALTLPATRALPSPYTPGILPRLLRIGFVETTNYNEVDFDLARTRPGASLAANYRAYLGEVGTEYLAASPAFVGAVATVVATVTRVAGVSVRLQVAVNGTSVFDESTTDTLGDDVHLCFVEFSRAKYGTDFPTPGAEEGVDGTVSLWIVPGGPENLPA